MRLEWALLLLAACGDAPCEAPPLGVPMTEARARQLAPGVSTGLGVSTTLVTGDCERVALETPLGCEEAGARCRVVRAPLRVYAIPFGQSVPVAEACGAGTRAEDALALAAAHGVASEGGEIVLSLAPGRYAVYLSDDGVCAHCGSLGPEGRCSVEITRDSVAARDLVLDRSFR